MGITLFARPYLITHADLLPVNEPPKELFRYAEDVAYSTTTADRLIRYYAQLRGVDEQTLVDTLFCESEFLPEAFNKTDPYGGAYGPAQFLKPTFDRYSKEVGEGLQYKNSIDQIKVAAYMFSIGEADQWTCYRNLKTGNP